MLMCPFTSRMSIYILNKFFEMSWSKHRPRKRSMIGYPSLHPALQNGGTRLSTMPPPWLRPVSRTAKWWYWTFHNATAMVEASVLSLPTWHMGTQCGGHDIAFAFAGHNVVLEIQATIPSTPEKPSKVPMWKGVIVATLSWPYAAFLWHSSVTTYYVAVDDNILLTLEKRTWLIASANMFVLVHVIECYQIYAMPVFNMLETFLVKDMKFKPSMWLRFVTRTLHDGKTCN